MDSISRNTIDFQFALHIGAANKKPAHLLGGTQLAPDFSGALYSYGQTRAVAGTLHAAQVRVTGHSGRKIARSVTHGEVLVPPRTHHVVVMHMCAAGADRASSAIRSVSDTLCIIMASG